MEPWGDSSSLIRTNCGISFKRYEAVPSDHVSEYANCSITVGRCSSSTPGRVTLVR